MLMGLPLSKNRWGRYTSDQTKGTDSDDRCPANGPGVRPEPDPSRAEAVASASPAFALQRRLHSNTRGPRPRACSSLPENASPCIRDRSFHRKLAADATDPRQSEWRRAAVSALALLASWRDG